MPKTAKILSGSKGMEIQRDVYLNRLINRNEALTLHAGNGGGYAQAFINARAKAEPSTDKLYKRYKK